MSKNFTDNFIKSHTRRKIQTHLLAWLCMSFSIYLFLNYFGINISPDNYLFITFYYLVFFYINYSFLIPSFLFRKKEARYVFFSTLLLLGAFYLRTRMSSVIMQGLGIGSENKFIAQNAMYFVHSGTDKLSGNPVLENTFSLLSANIIVILYVAGLSVRLVENWQMNENYKTKLEVEKSSAQLSLCRQQINPHFIFNTLNNIYSLSITNSEGVSESLLKLSSILRYVLYESEDDLSDTDNELSIIENYIQLQKLRFCDDVSVSYKFICEPVQHKIEPMIILTLLENAFKYGILPGVDSFVDINLQIINGRLTLAIKNKIVRSPQEGKKVYSGIGLKNIRQQLDLLYPGRYKYNVDINNKIYSVSLDIEL